jgi:hypothetical protein
MSKGSTFEMAFPHRSRINCTRDSYKLLEDLAPDRLLARFGYFLVMKHRECLKVAGNGRRGVTLGFRVNRSIGVSASVDVSVS